MNQLWQYLNRVNNKIAIQYNYKNLEYFQISNVLYWQHAGWVKILCSYNFIREYQEGKKSPAIGQSKRCNYKIGYKRKIAILLANLTVTIIII